MLFNSLWKLKQAASMIASSSVEGSVTSKKVTVRATIAFGDEFP